MIQAFFSALSGFKSFQTRLSVGANNIANVNTAGFQAQKTAAEDLIYTDQPRLDPERPPLQAGSGVRTSGIVTSLEGGALEQTGRSEDAALMGEGFFAVQNADGEVFYTRNGNFHYEVREGVNYLATANGELVLDESLSPVTAGADGQKPALLGPRSQGVDDGGFAQDFAQDFGEGFEEGESPAAARLAVFTFANPYGLARDGYGRLAATAASGEGELYAGAQVKQGFLEGSNVNLIAEMSSLMQAQRGYQFNAKVIQTADELENIANTLRQ